MQVDHPTYRASNAPSSITFGPPRLVLPTVDSSSITISGTGEMVPESSSP